MVTLAQIRGQARAVAILERAIAMDRVPHAYLFCGPAGCGKHTAGLALAAAMNCTTSPGKGCGECDSCHKIDTAIHPDVMTLERQGAAQIIPIEVIRGQVISVLGMPPHEARVRVILIEEAMSLQGAAANALLKTLEEPPQRTHFVLCTTSPESLLPTIRSRCQRVSFLALPADMRAALDQDEGAAERLGGLVDDLARAVAARDFASMSQAAAHITADKADVLPALDLLAGRLHARARSVAVDGDLDRAAMLCHQAMAVLDTRAAVAGNAHGQLALEVLVHTLRTTL